jgi:outer membrane protein assembly factor BamB
MRVILSSISTMILCFPFVVTAAQAAPNEWYTYRHDTARSGAQPDASDLSDPNLVRKLHVAAQFPPAGAPAIPGGFKASPIVVNDTVFIGDVNGVFYALDAATLTLKWQYPDPGTALIGSDPNGYWQYGFESSASFWDRPPNGAIIFGAQDPSLGKFGSDARLFAFEATPTRSMIWQSDAIAMVTGDTSTDPGQLPAPDKGASLTELHQRMAWTAPLIFNNKAYVGIHDFGDSPIQVGRVIAVDLASHHIDRTFQFQAVGTPASLPQVRGGGVWNALATDGTGIYFTTGNTRIPWAKPPYTPPNCLYPSPNCPLPEPSPNRGLSMIRINKDTGKPDWTFQPVDYNHDGDPDWAAGATVMSTSCGELIASVQKDGWSYAIDAERGPSCPLSGNSWQFPPTTRGCPFTDPSLVHGDDDYRRPGAAWNDVFIVRTGGENLVLGTVKANYNNLHALNACARTEVDRVRWIAHIRNRSDDIGHESFSAPTVTGGIIFIGTRRDWDDTEKQGDNRGHLVVFGDHTIVPANEQICSNPDFPLFMCLPPYAPVWSLKPLADVAMPDGGSLAAMRNEPVLAGGRVFVATHPRTCDDDNNCLFQDAGHVYMLTPRPEDISTLIPGIFAPGPEDISTITPGIFAPDMITPTIETD